MATVVANEWKDGSDKVMPVKQWLEERRFLQVTFLFSFAASFSWRSPLFHHFMFLFGQGEMQQLRDKLAIADRAAKSEAQLKVTIFSLLLVLFCFSKAF